jgi:hypothetical protein
MAAARVLLITTNSFTSARVAVFNPPRGLEEGSRICEQFFGFPIKKNFRSKKSVAMPRAAPAGAYPAARLIFLPPAASVGFSLAGECSEAARPFCL